MYMEMVKISIYYCMFCRQIGYDKSPTSLLVWLNLYWELYDCILYYCLFSDMADTKQYIHFLFLHRFYVHWMMEIQQLNQNVYCFQLDKK